MPGSVQLSPTTSSWVVNMAPTYAETIALANAGKLTFRQFTDWWTTASFAESQGTQVAHVQAILNTVDRTEPSQAWVKDHYVTIVNGQVSVTTKIKGGVPKVLGDAASGGAAAVSSITSIVDFLKLLTSPALWLRVAEVLLGMLLVGAGLSKVSSRASTTIQRIPIAGKVLT